jgi:16S rRNA (adenine1518-N6/adenine1519-N6)-dimethyltransferase
VATVRTRRQKLGQHFLHDPGIARAVAAALADTPPKVLEIGPGKGDLTRPLLDRFGTVRAVELDARLAHALPRRLGDPANLEVRHGDGLVLDLDELADGGPWQVAANLPYSVGTPILRRLLPRYDLFTVLVVMLQLEVARRLVAPPGGPGRGLLTLEAESHSRAELLFTVPPRCFSPPPRVTSAVVRLALRTPSAPAATVERALELASAAFTHRRKKLVNALASIASPDAVATAVVAAGADSDLRPQDPPLSLWLALARELPAPGAA